MTPHSLHVAIATDRPLVRWQARCVEAIAAVPGIVIDRWLQASAVRPDDRPTGCRRPDDRGRARHPVRPSGAGYHLTGRRADRAEPAHRHPPRPDGRWDRSDDARDGDLALRLWTRPRSRPCSGGADRVPAQPWCCPGRARQRSERGDRPRGLAPGGFMVDRQAARAPADRSCGLAGDRCTSAARRGRIPRLAGAGRRHAAERRPDKGRSSIPAMPDRALEVAALGRRVRGFVDVLGRHPDWNIGIIDAPIDQVSSLTAPSVTCSPFDGIVSLPTRSGSSATESSISSSRTSTSLRLEGPSPT